MDGKHSETVSFVAAFGKAVEGFTKQEFKGKFLVKIVNTDNEKNSGPVFRTTHVSSVFLNHRTLWNVMAR